MPTIGFVIDLKFNLRGLNVEASYKRRKSYASSEGVSAAVRPLLSIIATTTAVSLPLAR